MKKNMVARAWGCVGLMMLGVIIGMSSMAFMNNQVMLVIVGILAFACFAGGIILHYAKARDAPSAAEIITELTKR